MKQSRIKQLQHVVTMVLFMGIAALLSCNSNGQGTATSAIQEPKISIHEAAFMGNTDQIQAHINAGSDLNAQDDYGSSALTIAAVFDKPEVAKLLVEAGADINITSGDGSTPLHSASFFCRKEIVELLLDHEADVTIRNNYGSTALESVSAPFDQVKPIYEQVSQDMGPLGLKLDFDYIEKTRPVIADLIRNNQ